MRLSYSTLALSVYMCLLLELRRNYRSKHIKITNQNILVSCINNTIDYGLKKKKKTLHQPCPSKIWRNTLSYVMNQVYRHWRPRHFKISSFTNFSRNTEKPFHKLPSSGESHTLLCYTFYCVWGAIFFEWGILKSCSREKPPTPQPWDTKEGSEASHKGPRRHPRSVSQGALNSYCVPPLSKMQGRHSGHTSWTYTAVVNGYKHGLSQGILRKWFWWYNRVHTKI